VDASVADLDRLVRANPSDRATRVRLVVALLRAGRVDEAWSAVRGGLALDAHDRAFVGFHDDLVELTGGAFTLLVARDPQPCAIDPLPPIALRASPAAIVIGRHVANAVIVHDHGVAPRPTVIELTREAGLVLRDNHSGSRTVRNGRAVQRERLLDGDRFGPSQFLHDLFEVRLDIEGASADALLESGSRGGWGRRRRGRSSRTAASSAASRSPRWARCAATCGPTSTRPCGCTSPRSRS
jgi:hypothetical protein